MPIAALSETDNVSDAKADGATIGDFVLVTAAKTRVVTRKTLSSQVADDLRQRILAGEIEEGTQLRQEQLAAEFGISKVPVREALHQLEAEGFVVQQFHRGAIVAGLSPDQILEIFELRKQIEVWLLSVAMSRATESDYARAQEINEKIALTDDANLYPALNWEFHEALYRPSGKAFVIEHLRKLHAQIERYVKLQFSLVGNNRAVAAQHREILAQYVAKDPKVLDLLSEHILGTAEELAERLARVNAERAARNQASAG